MMRPDRYYAQLVTQESTAMVMAALREVIERHGLDLITTHALPTSGELYHPPCLGLRVKQLFYALAMVAYNLLQAIKLLELTDECQGWRWKPRLGKLLVLSVRMGRRSQQVAARLLVPPAWLVTGAAAAAVTTVGCGTAAVGGGVTERLKGGVAEATSRRNSSGARAVRKVGL